jgi:hypothetical protein
MNCHDCSYQSECTEPCGFQKKDKPQKVTIKINGVPVAFIKRKATRLELWLNHLYWKYFGWLG